MPWWGKQRAQKVEFYEGEQALCFGTLSLFKRPRLEISDPDAVLHIGSPCFLSQTWRWNLRDLEVTVWTRRALTQSTYLGRQG